nr:metallophosphoesterase [Ruegeria sp. Ofav3-42]
MHGFSLAEDHDVVLEQIVAALEQHQPDLFIIAGDLFDRPAPPATATRQFNRFLARSRQVSRFALFVSRSLIE